MTAPPPGEYWFGPVARFLGPAYLRNAFTKGTEQEVAFLWERLGLRAGDRVLDVGCGPGRHALALARRGAEVVGVDASEDFVALARDAAAREGLRARFDVRDVRHLVEESAFDVVVCLCQGGFGLLGGRDEIDVFARIVRAVRPDGGLAVSAFSSLFAVRFLEAGETFDAATGVLHERAPVRNDAGEEQIFDLWTTCFTARELELLAAGADVAVDGVYGVTPGRYCVAAPDLDSPELLLLGRRRARGDTSPNTSM